MEEYLINFDRKIKYVVRKNRADEQGVDWLFMLEEIFLDKIPIKQFLTHIELASCKQVGEVVEVLTKKEGKPVTEEALLKRAQRTVKNVLNQLESKLEVDCAS